MFEPVYDWLLRWGTVIGGLGSVLLSIVLVILYRQQKNLLRDQFIANHRAKLEVSSAFPTENQIDINLSNVGNGVATDLEIAILGVYTTEGGELRDGITSNKLDRAYRFESKSGSLEANETDVHYVGRITIPAVQGDGGTGFETGIREMVREDITACCLYLYLLYSDFTNEQRSEFIKGWKFEPIDEAASAEECIEKGEEMWLEIPDLDPETMDYDLSEVTTGKEKTVL